MNAEELRQYATSKYPQKRLKEKGLKRDDVIQASGLRPQYAQHIFAGRKNTARRYLLALALRLTTRFPPNFFRQVQPNMTIVL